MKKAKLLSLLLAGSLLFHTAGIDVLATAPLNPAPINETVETTGDDISEQLSEGENDSKEAFEEESNPEQPSREESESKEPTSEEDNPEQPSEEEGEVKEPTEEEDNSQLPSEEEEEEIKTPAEEEPNPEQPSEEEGEVKEPAEEEPSPELPSEEDSEIKEPAAETPAPENSISENTVTEDTISENTLPEEAEDAEEEEDAFDAFPGLGSNYIMSAQQLADKQVLASHLGDIVRPYSKNASDYPDAKGLYELGEVVYLADTEAEAAQVAKAFGGTLDSYSYEVAVIALPKNVTVALAVAAAADPDTKLPAIWPNYYHHLDSDTTEVNASSAPTGDPGFAEQWQHDYIGTRYAWAAGFKGQGVKVAVIDTGLAKDHEDLAANALAGKTFVDGAAGTEHNTDNATHGTHVAGIIAADDNGKGGIGIAPDATVRGYCVFASADASADSGDILRAINAAVQDGNDIINMSLGTAYYDKNYEDVVNNAYKKGVAIFASAGNSDTNGYNFPAAFSSTISVGAVDQNGTRAPFSNYGSTVTLSFPGVQIYSTLPTGYGRMNGTSQASPAAAGTAAVILSANETIRNKTGKARVDALRSAMKSSTTKCTNSGMGAGTTWLPGALKIATDLTAPDAPTIDFDEKNYTKDATGKNFLTESVEVTFSTKTAVGVEIYYTTDGKNPTYKNGEITNAALYTPGDRVSLGGAKKVTVKAVALNPITGKISKTASKTFNLAPIPTNVTVTSANNVSRIAAGKSLKFTAVVTPSYAVSNKVQWSVDAAAKTAGITITNGTVKTKATTPEGTYTVTATSVGSNGKTFNGVSSEPYSFTVIKTADIKKVAFIDPATKKTLKSQPLNTDEIFTLTPYLKVTKKDNTELTAAAAADTVVWFSSNTKVAQVENGVITAISPGKAVIKAVSNDGGNKSASYNVTVKQPVTEITISGPQKVAVGRSVTLTAKVTPANATNKKLTWTVNGNDKITVSASGKVTAKKGATGSCTITATAKDGSNVSKDYNITILSGEITTITLSKNSMVLFPPNTGATVTTTATLKATVDGKDGADKTLIAWTSSAPSIVAVDDGKITAKKAGKAVITCASTDGSNKKATCTVNVNVPMSKLVIGPADSYGMADEGCIAVGKKIKMCAKYTSNYGLPTDKKVTWSSSNPNILSVDKNGTVTADKNAPVDGKTPVTITATAADGSKVTSNEYKFIVTPLYKKLTIEDGFVAVAWDNKDDGYTIPYYTITVSGGKNPGIDKIYDEDDKCYYFAPIPGRITTTKPSSSTKLYTNELQKMTVTIKLRDGSGLTAKKTLYVARFSNDKIKFFK